jgi:hypothetical protein
MNNTPIPVIGTAVVNSVFWVKRLIMSVDYPVDTLFIINNNGRNELTEELDQLTKIPHSYIKRIHVTHMPANVGVASAWNLIVKCFLNAPYWIICNDDVAFGSGFLEEMITSANNDPEAGLVYGNPGDFNVGSWDLFLIKDFVVQKYGLFDENLYPAYCEDADYIIRTIYSPVKKILSLNSMYYHGDGDKTQYYETGSQTKKTDPSLKQGVEKSNELNIEYLSKKWGPGWRTLSPEPTPFKNYPVPVSCTTFDLEFVRKKYLGF